MVRTPALLCHMCWVSPAWQHRCSSPCPPSLSLSRSSAGREVAMPELSPPSTACLKAAALLSEQRRASEQASQPPPVIIPRAAQAPGSFAFRSTRARYWIPPGSSLQPLCSLPVLTAVYTAPCSRNHSAYSLLLIDRQGN